MLREELDQLKSEIDECSAVIGRLVREWVDDLIDKAEYDERTAEPLAMGKALRARRREIQSRPLARLAANELNALVTDLLECRADCIERKKGARAGNASSDREAYQHRLQAIADEVEWYTVRLEEIGKLGVSTDSIMVWADCRYCRHRIARRNEVGGVWLHCDVYGMPLQFWGGRGCRAASFDRDGDWNDALPRDRQANPTRRP